LNTRLFSFIGGEIGPWRVVGNSAIVGEGLAEARRLQVIGGFAPEVLGEGTAWRLQGVTSNERYVTRPEKDQLVAEQPVIGRSEATCAALIPIRKTAAWWGLTQDERRRIFEDDSRHIAIGMQYLPAVARRLHHCRDLGGMEPFDFLTWFEFAPPNAAAFDDLLEKLRASEEWKYVDREVEIRLVREE